MSPLVLQQKNFAWEIQEAKLGQLTDSNRISCRRDQLFHRAATLHRFFSAQYFRIYPCSSDVLQSFIHRCNIPVSFVVIHCNTRIHFLLDTNTNKNYPFNCWHLNRHMYMNQTINILKQIKLVHALMHLTRYPRDVWFECRIRHQLS
jgi:hypothetical protein